MSNANNVSGKSSGLSLDAKRWIYIGISLVTMILIKNVSFPASFTTINGAELTAAGQEALAVLVFALLLWITEAIPFHFTGLLAMALMALFGVDSFGSIVKTGFGNVNVIFFIGVFILSAFINKSGLGKRLVNMCLSVTGNSTKYVLLGFLVVGVLLSMWISNMAVAAMLMPLAKALLDEEGVKPLESNFGKALLMSVAWGSLIGGFGTPAGNGPNPLAIGFMKDLAGVDVSFLDWMKYGIPVSIVLIPIAWGLLLLMFKPEMKYLKKSNEEIKEEFKNQPKLSRDEKVTLVIFVLTVVIWVFSSQLSDLLGIDIPISLPVVLTTMFFFFPGISETKYKAIEKEMSWSSIILVLSGVSIGTVLYQTGVANWIALGLLGNIGGMSPVLMVFIVVLSISLMNITLSSATVSASIVIPIIIELAASLGIPALGIAFPAALASSLAFILITSTPTNVIAYSAGYFSIKDFAKAGVPMTVVSCVVVAGIMYGVGLLTGLY
ncbi:SLC13 family permease [Mediterraneibacter agrestimuris]|uniref:SLC13 family permease n=1 Tax=Mediterraneibacter agrestimuris TaxID=2941333 RepID=UPI00203A5F96|nr:DASS family sodium-coupled anion symporter [Mediterraneibacter agrestimuris]